MSKARRELRQMSMNELNNLKHTQRRESLLPSEEDQAKRIWNIIGPYSASKTYERFEHEFTFDQNPDKELNEVETIALAFQDWCKANPFASENAKKDALTSGYMLSTCVVGVPIPFPEMANYYAARGGKGKPISINV